jgi:hypothetical protein
VQGRDPIGMGIGDDRGGSDRAQHMSRQIRKMQSGEAATRTGSAMGVWDAGRCWRGGRGMEIGETEFGG